MLMGNALVPGGGLAQVEPSDLRIFQADSVVDLPSVGRAELEDRSWFKLTHVFL